MILTVTLNAALDLTYRVPRLTPHASHRVREVTERPGGKGLNVARVLAALGFETTVTGFAGGDTGRELRTLLAADRTGVTDALVEVSGRTRRTVGVVDESTGDTTQLNEPGPHVGPQEWDSFLDAYRLLLRSGTEAVALCGSLPPGVPVGAYAELVREARTTRTPVLLDTSGEPLRRGLAARPELVKPNAHELAGITGTSEPLRAARAAQRRGARAVAASLGADGMLMVTQDGTWSAGVPERLTGNPTGAGDSAVAGLLSGLAEGLPWPDRLARAVALSAATVRSPVAGEFDEETYARLLPSVRVQQVDIP
ncbi:MULTISPECIES: 1-phosphofructokinase family hexose kinase [unclassified Streptomyces]|uniref:1-phosphofructokinase family hexose kinase n=1 Tax=unclassified Streptomyces TaxID=2593676 RepID=UPI002DD8803A|nr:MULTISPECIES: 1-phosphofructokinase family hexose kinase [unclassified Streptomyces]WSA93946.1 1-phosphofructokinase family hexose kinase [Streptomyces sp. NBC_01795]WSB78372.1 1-phosphofructokinase family hexose kinase [Streptomyces sp. NBC_01775]WSS13425.1 1-phosphofructokinase family hexose kinase [Streptomyces sp. NBC_01186]WSS42214.1 1-phosphofructokinase family hexose kinase [Streptomyces sp. NBC_01187]